MTVLVEVARLRLLARAAGITDIVMAGTRVRMAPVHLLESRTLRPEPVVSGQHLQGGLRHGSGTAADRRRLRRQTLADHALIQWARSLIESVLDTSRE